jgi:hypothetical protein
LVSLPAKAAIDLSAVGRLSARRFRVVFRTPGARLLRLPQLVVPEVPSSVSATSKPLIGIDPHIADASLFGVILYTGDAGGQPQPNALGVGAGRSMPPLEPAD